jgi:hypothetical protein
MSAVFKRHLGRNDAGMSYIPPAYLETSEVGEKIDYLPVDGAGVGGGDPKNSSIYATLLSHRTDGLYVQLASGSSTPCILGGLSQTFDAWTYGDNYNKTRFPTGLG